MTQKHASLYFFVFSSGNAAVVASFFYSLFVLCKCCFNDSEMEKELKRHIHGIFNEHLRMHHYMRYLSYSRAKKEVESACKSLLL